MDEPGLAFGVLLRLTTTAEGGRQTPLTGGWGEEARFAYRPNWGLPGMTPPNQAGALVLGFDQRIIAPGDTTRVVIVPPFPPMMQEWDRVQPGADLPMYEGARVCGHGRVLWRRSTLVPLPPADEERFRLWLIDGSEYGEPEG